MIFLWSIFQWIFEPCILFSWFLVCIFQFLLVPSCSVHSSFSQVHMKRSGKRLLQIQSDAGCSRGFHSTALDYQQHGFSCHSTLQHKKAMYYIILTWHVLIVFCKIHSMERFVLSSMCQHGVSLLVGLSLALGSTFLFGSVSFLFCTGKFML